LPKRLSRKPKHLNGKIVVSVATGDGGEWTEIWKGQNPMLLWEGTDKICFDNIYPTLY